MNNNDIPVWEKYTLTIEEASKYFRIGENKLRRLAEENKDAGWLIMNGNRIQIKRRQFEQVIDKLNANQRDIFQHVPITSRKPVKPDSKGVPGFFAFWGSSRILANPGAS